MTPPRQLAISMAGLPEDPEPQAIFLQELAMDLAEAIDAEAPWQASFGDDRLTLDAGTFGFAICAGASWRIDVWGGADAEQRLRDAVDGDPRVLWRIGPS